MKRREEERLTPRLISCIPTSLLAIADPVREELHQHSDPRVLLIFGQRGIG